MEVESQVPYIVRAVAMYAPSDAPNMSPGNGRSYVKVKYEFETDAPVSGRAEVIIMQSASIDTIGHREGDRLLGYCCTSKLFAAEE